jgi:thiamine kinase-like enzyme
MKGEIIKDLSSPYTNNRVFLFDSEKHGKIIRKEYDQSIHFRRVIEAFKVVDRSLHPAIYKIDMRRQHVYMSYNPIQAPPDSMDACAVDLMKKLHTSTRRYGGVRDPGTGQVFSSWKNYLQQKGEKNLEALKSIGDYSQPYERLMTELKDSPFSPVSYIHCDIRPFNIGERDGHYILLGFEQAMIGDPYWDVARYVVQEAQAKESFYKIYGIEDVTRANIHVWLFALDFAAYLVRHRSVESKEFEKCLAVLNDKRYA